MAIFDKASGATNAEIDLMSKGRFLRKYVQSQHTGMQVAGYIFAIDILFQKRAARITYRMHRTARYSLFFPFVALVVSISSVVIPSEAGVILLTPIQ